MLETCHIVYCPNITAASVGVLISGCANMKKILVEKCKVSERTKRRAGSIVNCPNINACCCCCCCCCCVVVAF